MRIITSVGPSRYERQLLCIKSWQSIGLDVVCVQSPGESAQFMDLYPGVEFVETDLVGDLFKKPHLVRIYALMKQAVRFHEPGLIMNSDIEVRCSKEEFESRWAAPKNRTLVMGVRWDEDPVTKVAKIQKWGIDAFLITPGIVDDVFDLGLSMGCPAWDYWIPLHLMKLGYQIVTHKHNDLIHESHPLNWSREDYEIGLRALRKSYGLNGKQAAMSIQRITGRKGVK